MNFFPSPTTLASILVCLALQASSPVPADLTRPAIKCLAPPNANAVGCDVIDQLAYLNPSMVRFEFIHTIDIRQYEWLADNLAEHDIEILGLIDYASLENLGSTEWVTEDFRNRYVAKVEELVARFSARENPIKHWEIWNEQDLDASGEGGPDWRIETEYYAPLLIAAYDAIKAIDPEAVVVLGGISPKGFEYAENYLDDLYKETEIQAYYTQNGKYPFDVVACHPYPEQYYNPDPSSGVGLADILNAEIKAVMNTHSDRHKKVWLTELGWPSRPYNFAPYVTEARQASYLQSSYEVIDTLVDPAFPSDEPYVDRYFWFQYRDFGEELLDNWGLFKADGLQKKPSYDAFLGLTPAGPPPPDGTVPSTPNDPVWDASTDAALPVQATASDILNGMIPTVVEGGFHGESQGGLDALTNGLFDANTRTLITNDAYQVPGEPIGVRLRYSFPDPVDLYEVRIFAGHPEHLGNRAFQSNDIYINGSLAVQELNTGNYGQESPLPDTVDRGAVSVVRWLPSGGETFVAQRVETMEIAFYNVTKETGVFYDRWYYLDDPDLDQDCATKPYMGSIIKEIDAFGVLSPPPSPGVAAY